jgi:endonuclease/exonuclease/phosphatase family metal-dependent hydrolase
VRHALLPIAVIILLAQIARAANDEIVVAAYNLANYAPIPFQSEDGKTIHKSGKSVSALIALIKEINPDILGVCEMGPTNEFEDFKSRLQAAGLGYKAYEYVQAVDQERHLALVSRFPIVARNSVIDAGYELNGVPEKVKRGFLDVTVEVNPHYQLRLLGVHLKSKRPVPGGDALIRRSEAHLLRQHIDAILAADPAANLLLYGDFNDVKNQPAIYEVTGASGSAHAMNELKLEDSLGDRWTYFWNVEDSYARIDFMFASPALLPEIVASKCRVHRSAQWNVASDHRPVVATIRAVNVK